jgi:hypothetical protein
VVAASVSTHRTDSRMETVIPEPASIPVAISRRQRLD